MTLEARFVPLTDWPGDREKSRQRARFDPSYQKTLELLADELRRLQARQVVIQAGFAAHDIRNDGWPRSNAKKPVDPGVILSFQSKHGPLSYPCDRFTDWQDNLRAIALSLQALRAVDRYGVTRRAEQYRGWTQLPPPPPQPPPFSGFATKRAAAEWLAQAAGYSFAVGNVLSDQCSRESAIRSARRRLHPDAGGSHEEFIRIEQARQKLEEPGA